MNVLHIISSGGMYGAESVVLNLSRTLNEGQHRSLLGVFANASNENLELHRIATGEGIESHLIPCRGRMDRKGIKGIRELVAQTGADIVHAHGYKADIYVYLAVRSLRMPFVSTCHNWIQNDRKAQFYGILDRQFLRRFSAIAAVSTDVEQRLLKAGVDAKRVWTIRNGIDLRPFDRARPALREELSCGSCPLVGLAGRLSIEKGVDVFLDAAAFVVKQLPEAKFVVAGDGPQRAELNSRIDQLGLRRNVFMLGRREDMPSFYASLDVLVSSSRLEGLPIGILEGMASRLPLVATTVGEIPNFVQNGRTGVLVRPEDPESLAEAIVALLKDIAKRERLGTASRQLVEEEFSARRMTADYIRFYERAVAAFDHGEGGRVELSSAPPGRMK